MWYSLCWQWFSVSKHLKGRIGSLFVRRPVGSNFLSHNPNLIRARRALGSSGPSFVKLLYYQAPPETEHQNRVESFQQPSHQNRFSSTKRDHWPAFFPIMNLNKLQNMEDSLVERMSTSVAIILNPFPQVLKKGKRWPKTNTKKW